MEEAVPKNPQGKFKIGKFINSPLFVAVVTSLITYAAAINTSNKAMIDLNNKAKNELSFEFRQQIINSQNQTVTTDKSGLTLSAKDEKKVNNESGNSFNSDDWLSMNDMGPNNEGFYCPKKPSFPSWSLWSKNKYLADRDIAITFYLLDKTDDDKNPTLYISYGDKDNDVPDAFYRFNIFDGDLNTLRLYGRKEDEKQFERSRNSAPLDKFITFAVSPVFLNKKSSILTLNPTISYQLDGREYSFEPKNQFATELPIPSSEKQGDGFHYGLGVSEGDCFKIISTNL